MVALVVSLSAREGLAVELVCARRWQYRSDWRVEMGRRKRRIAGREGEEVKGEKCWTLHRRLGTRCGSFQE